MMTSHFMTKCRPYLRGKSTSSLRRHFARSVGNNEGSLGETSGTSSKEIVMPRKSLLLRSIIRKNRFLFTIRNTGGQIIGIQKHTAAPSILVGHFLDNSEICKMSYHGLPCSPWQIRIPNS